MSQRDVRTTRILEAARRCMCVDKFLPFQCLPVELRLKIWKYALPGPRIILIGIRQVTEDNSYSYEDPDIVAIDLYSMAHVEDRVYLLLACRESRQVALAKLRGTIPMEIVVNEMHALYSDDQPPTPNQIIRFDPIEDVIYFPNLEKLSGICVGQYSRSQIRSAFRDIQRMIISAHMLSYFSEGWDLASVRQFESLKSVFAVIQHVKGKESYEIVRLTEGSDSLRPTTMSTANGNIYRRAIQKSPYDHAREIVEQNSHLHVSMIGLRDRHRDKGFINRLMRVSHCEHCTSFHQFSELPVEIRLKIWKYAIPTSRFIRVKVYRVGSKKRLQFRVKADHDPIALLGVNIESRKATLEEYTVCLESDGIDRKIRCSPDDVLYFHNMEKWFDLREKCVDNNTWRAAFQDIMNLRNIAMDSHTLLDSPGTTVAATAYQFKALARIFAVRFGNTGPQRLAKHRNQLLRDGFTQSQEAVHDTFEDYMDDYVGYWNYPFVQCVKLVDEVKCNSCIGSRCPGRSRRFSREFIEDHGRYYTEDGYRDPMEDAR